MHHSKGFFRARLSGVAKIRLQFGVKSRLGERNQIRFEKAPTTDMISQRVCKDQYPTQRDVVGSDPKCGALQVWPQEQYDKNHCNMFFIWSIVGSSCVVEWFWPIINWLVCSSWLSLKKNEANLVITGVCVQWSGTFWSRKEQHGRGD